MSVMCLAAVPHAMSDDSGKWQTEKRAWGVVRESTQAEVVRSQVLSEWSQEVLYATVWSFKSKVTSDTCAVCRASKLSGPRWGLGLLLTESLRRLFEAEGRRFSGAVVFSDFLVDQRPTVWSAEAERMREDGEWTARASTDALWP